MTTETLTATRTIIRIIHDESCDEPGNGGSENLGHRLQAPSRDYRNTGDGTIHEQLRGVSVAVRVDVPTSWTDRSAPESIMYATRADLIREYGKDTAETRALALACLKAEAEEWRAWADGDCYGFTVTRERKCATCGQWERVEDDRAEDCWGFITRESSDLREWIAYCVTDDQALAALDAAIDDLSGGSRQHFPTVGMGISEG